MIDDTRKTQLTENLVGKLILK